MKLDFIFVGINVTLPAAKNVIIQEHLFIYSDNPYKWPREWAGVFWGEGGGHPKIFELKGGPSQKLKAEEVFYR